MNINSSERSIMIGRIIVMTQWTCSQPARRAELMTAIKKSKGEERRRKKGGDWRKERRAR